MKRIALFALMSIAFLASTHAGEFAGKRILMVVTSHGQIDADHPTGLWLEEFATPYEMFLAAGHSVTVASPKGGVTPVDPRSEGEKERYEATTWDALQSTALLGELDLSGFDAVFFPGGHGTMFDLPEDGSVIAAVNHFLRRDQPAAFVCHGPAALVGATAADGSPAVAGRRITGFTNDEEVAVELDDDMPFLLETRLREQGGDFVGAPNFTEHVVVDGNLITGQNPASSAAAAKALLEALAP